MLIPELTNLRSKRIGVTPNQFGWPTECIFCGEKKFQVKPIRFTHVIIAGGVGGGESFMSNVPFCVSCEKKILNRESRIATILGVLFLIGLSLEGLAFYLNNRSPDFKYTGEIGFIGALPILGSMIGMLSAKVRFPIQLIPHTHGKFGSGEYGAFVFEFPDEMSAQRFLKANENNIVEPNGM